MKPESPFSGMTGKGQRHSAVRSDSWIAVASALLVICLLQLEARAAESRNPSQAVAPQRLPGSERSFPIAAVPDERALSAVCARLPPENDWLVAELPDDERLQLDELLQHVRWRSLRAARCAGRLARFLAIRGERWTGEAAAASTAASRNLLWNLVEQQQSTPELGDAYTKEVKAALEMMALDTGPKTLRGPAILGLSLVDGADRALASLTALRADLVLSSTTGRSLETLLTVGYPDTSASSGETTHPFERERVEWFLAAFFVTALQASTEAEFFEGATLPSNLADADPPLRAIQLLRDLHAMSPSIVERATIEWLRTSKPIAPPVNLVGERGLEVLPHFKVSSRVYVGRCGEETRNHETSGLQDDFLGFGCPYSPGTNGKGAVQIDALQEFKSVGKANLWIIVQSQAHGGHWGGEDETTEVSYSIEATASIPECTDPSTCNPFVQIEFVPSGDSESEPTFRHSATYREAGAPQSSAIGPRQLITVDRSRGPVQLAVTASRSDRHVGACCYKNWKLHDLKLNVFVGWFPMDEGWFNRVVGILAARRQASLKVVAGSVVPEEVAKAHRVYTLGQIVAQRPLEQPFERRFVDLYYKLWTTEVLRTHASGLLNAVDLRSLELARPSLSSAIRAKYMDTVRQIHTTMHQTYATLDPRGVTNAIDKGIAELISTATTDEIDTLEFLDGLGARYASSLGGYPVAEAAEETRKTAASRDRAATLIQLMKLRGHMAAFQQTWTRTMTDLAVELSLIQSQPPARN